MEPKEQDGELAPKEQSLLRSSALMASGTLVSRVLGFVRSAMLVSAIGVTAGTAASFQLANTLPTMVYNLLAAGVLDAVLVPQIVKALRTKAGSPYVNKLITLVGSILFALTMAAMVATPLLISLFAPTLEPETRALAITFALWCVPQVFFYGVYNLFGQILNARGVFGPYMWAPVVNNVVAIISLGAFLAMWGPAGEVLPAGDFTSTQTVVLAGSATLGVVLQALVLIVPIRRSGVKLAADFRFRGTSFGSAPKVATWTFATLMVSQIGVISTTNIVTRADTWTDKTGEIVAGLQAYQYAFMMFMLPQSLITVTIVTALFTRLASYATERDLKGVAESYDRGSRLIAMLMMLAAGVLMVAATPLMQILMPTFGTDSASLYGAVLVALALGAPFSGITMMSQRVFYALEDARPVFLISLVPAAVQLAVGWGIYFSTSAEWWTVGAAAAETASRILQGLIGLYLVSRFVPLVRVGRNLKMIGIYGVATVGASLVGWALLHLLGPGSDSSTGFGRVLQAGLKAALVGLVITLCFAILLRFMDPAGFASLSSAITSKLPRRGGSDRQDPPDLAGLSEAAAELAEEATEPLGTGSPPPTASELSLPTHEAPGKAAWAQEPPEWEELFSGSLGAAQLAPSLPALDPPSTGSLPVVTAAMVQVARDGVQQGATRSRRPEALEEERSTPGSLGQERPQPGGTTPMWGGRGEPQRVPAARRRAQLMNANRRRRTAGGRFNPTVPALIIGIVVLVLGVWFASQNLFLGTGLTETAPPPPVVPQSEEESEETVEDPGGTAPPVVSGVAIYSWADDGGDHPDLGNNALTDDPATYWRSRYFTPATYAQAAPAAMLVNLAEPAVVSEVTITVIGSGGEVAILDSSEGDPRQGEVLAVAPLSGTTVIPLAEKVEVSSLGLVFSELPVDDEGRNRLKVVSVTVE